MKIMSRFALLSVLALIMACPAHASEKGNPHNISKCLLCHQTTPRFGVDTKDTVTFRGGKTFDDPELCTYCHDLNENLHPLLVIPGKGGLGTNAPSRLPLGSTPGFEGKVVCTTCHFLHAAKTDHALLRGFAGSQQPNAFEEWQDFCRECHGPSLEKRSPHAGDDRACAFCHTAKPVAGSPVDVAPRGLELCNFCHGGLQDGHYAKANPFDDDATCMDCHDPHLGPDRPARLKSEYLTAAAERVDLSPHYRRALCFACHLEEEGSPLRSDNAVVLCNRCHGTGEIVGDIHPLKKVPDSFSPPADWPLDKDFLTCMTCHLAGHEEHRGTWKFLRGGPYEDRNDFCRNCHDPMSYGDRNPHLDINEGKGCEFCHAERPVPGRDTIETVKFLADPNLLCLRCHETAAHPADVEHTMTVDAERAGEIPEELPVYRGEKIVCATCHNPHVAEVENHKLRGEVGSMQICTFCHKY